VTQPVLDPITLAVVSGSLSSTIKDMTEIIRKTARSATIAIGHDFSATLFGVFDGVPVMVWQGDDQPVHLGVLIHKMKIGAAYFGADVAADDLMYHNDPPTGGNHLPDTSMYRPIFYAGKLFAWAAVTAHMPETGGPVPGGFNPDTETLFGEGLRIPHVKLCDAGRMRKDVWNLILSNVRTPEAMGADMGAMVSALSVADARLTALCEKFGLETVHQCMRQVVDRAKDIAREEVLAIPDGTYRGADVMEGSAHGSDDIRVECTLRVAGDRMHVALSAPPQTANSLNSYPSNTISAIYWAYLSALRPGIPVNEGLYAPLDVDIGPEGSLLNPAGPVATYASTGATYALVFSAVCQALSRAIPDRACAAWCYQNTVTFAGVDPRDGQPFAYMSHLMSKGGGGAYHGRDGGHLWGLPAAGGANMTGEIELLEFRLPICIVRHELLADSGCPGTWRGGCGATLEIEVQCADGIVTRTGSGVRHAPASRLGGGSRLDRSIRVHRVWVRDASGSTDELLLHSLRRLKAGDRVLGEVAGGGGVGPAWQRDPQAVEADVRTGLVTARKAEEEYGVAFNPDGLGIDLDRTRVLRNALAHRVPGESMTP
jgi:N-methylhydantoinase B